MSVYLGSNKVSMIGGTEICGTIEPVYQEKMVTPTEENIIVESDEGFDALSKVTVNAISKIYVGSGIERKSSADLTENGAVINVPPGYYASNSSKSVATTTQAMPTISVSVDGMITATSTQSEGYVPSGTKTGTKQLDIQEGETVTSNKTLSTKGKYMTGDIVVNIPSTGIDTSDATATENKILENETAYVKGQKITGNIPIHCEELKPRNYDQYIPDGYYTGTYVKGDVNLRPDNIRYGTSIFGTLGDFKGSTPSLQQKTVSPSEVKQEVKYDSTYDGLSGVIVNAIPSDYIGSAVVFHTYYVDTNVPDNAIGNDDDIYLKIGG